MAVLLPARGVSAIDREGQPFDDPAARRALHEAIKRGLPEGQVIELDLHINDVEFADAAAQRLMGMLNASRHLSAGEVTDLRNGATKATKKTENTY